MRSPTGPAAAGGASETALRAILVYKLVKGLLLLTASVVLIVTVLVGLSTGLEEHAARLHAHATRAWALHASELLARVVTPRWLHWSAVALALDGGINLVEAWALQKRHPWGPWLVVGVTGLFLPAEAFEMWRHPRPARLVLLLVNLIVLVFLVWYARRHAAHLAPPNPQGAASSSGTN
ncbi:MAG TPA: DUF2127 domain-containing protein [Myxococcaceae bacterium]|nr:DUF2127 domain-containing protein [Myxococcaceae bacterium]